MESKMKLDKSDDTFSDEVVNENIDKKQERIKSWDTHRANHAKRHKEMKERGCPGMEHADCVKEVESKWA